MRVMKALSVFLSCVSALLCRAQINILKFPEGVAVAYWAVRPLEKGDADAEYAVICIHGLDSRINDSTPAFKAIVKGHPNARRTIFIKPAFFSRVNCHKNLLGKVALWDTKKHDWRRGARSLGEHGVSSYAVIDRIYALLADRARYPKLKHILLCGFSAGGQVVNRYVAVGRLVPAKHLDYSFAVGAPSSYLYIDGRRITPDGSFAVPEPPPPDLEAWHDGLQGRCPYAADLSVKEILANLASRPTLFMCGAEDVLPRGLIVTPGAMTQGENRYKRFLNYQKYIALYPEWAKQCRFVGVPGFGHQWSKVFAAPEFVNFVYGERK